MTGECKRKYDRVPLDLSVRFISRQDLESSGRLTDISEGGLAMLTDANAEIGDEIIAYPEGLGRLTGIVRRRMENGLAVEFSLSEAQRSHLRKRINSAVTGVPYIRLLENRNHKRMNLHLLSEAQEMQSNKLFQCEIIDLSESGAKIRSTRQPNIGAKIRIGSLRGVVRRHTYDGFAISFCTRMPEERACA